MKSSTAILVVGGVASVAGIGYLLWKKNSEGVPVLAGPGQQVGSVNPALLTQPSQVYPSQYGSGQVVRQDTASQPWYGGARPVDASANLVDQNFIQNVQYAKGTADIISSVGSIWDDLNLGSLWESEGSYFEEDSSSEIDWGSWA